MSDIKMIPAKVMKLYKHHVDKEPLVYIVEKSTQDISFIVKSISREAQIYTITRAYPESWVCDCPAFKYRRRLKEDACKHIEFIKILISKGIQIDEM